MNLIDAWLSDGIFATDPIRSAIFNAKIVCTRPLPVAEDSQTRLDRMNRRKSLFLASSALFARRLRAATGGPSGYCLEPVPSGNPLASIPIHNYIASSSPYDNVKRRAYPPVLATSSVADDRVGFWEPAKWIAKLRADDMGRNPSMLCVEMGGHVGSSGWLARLHQKVLFYAFSISELARGCTRGD